MVFPDFQDEKHSLPAIAQFIFSTGNIPISQHNVTTFLLEHPLNASLLALSQLFSECQIENLLLEVSSEDLPKMQFPLVSTLNINGEQKFVLIESVHEKTVNLFINNERKDIPIETFTTLWNENPILLFSLDTYQIAEAFQPAKNQINRITRLSLVFICIFSTSILLKFNTVLLGFSSSLFYFIFSLLTVAGLYTTILIFLKSSGKSNETLNRFCKTEKVDGCAFILNSRFSNILPGISWVSLGFVFFSAVLIFMLICPQVDSESIQILFYLYLLSIPGILLSFFIQKFLSDYWCKLCVIVQFILIASIIVLWFSGNNWTINLNYQYTLYLLLSLAFGLLVWQLFKSQVDVNLNLEGTKKLLQTVKLDPNTIQGHFPVHPPDVMFPQLSASPLLIGSENASINILFITNPSCVICGKKYRQLCLLLEKYSEDINLSLAFHLYEDEADMEKLIHCFHNIYQFKKELLLPEINKWYEKEHQSFSEYRSALSERHPNLIVDQPALPPTLISETEHLPLIYFNGRPFPAFYDITDIPYLLPWFMQLQ